MSLLVLLLLLAVCQQVLMVEPVDPHEKLINPPKRRLSLQNTGPERRVNPPRYLPVAVLLVCLLSRSLAKPDQTTARSRSCPVIQCAPLGPVQHIAPLVSAAGDAVGLCAPCAMCSEACVEPAELEKLSLPEIQNCLISSGDVGCATFQCFSNNSCEIRGLHHICYTLLHNAGSYDSQGKWLVKEALRCAAMGLRQRFSCVSRRCGTVGAMLFSLLRECFTKHRLCLALRDHPDTVGDLVHFHLLTPPGPYVELVNFLLGCGEEVRSWVSGRLRAQCSQQWGSSVCAAIGSTCPFNQSDLTLQPATLPPRTMPQPITGQSPLPQHTHRSGAEDDKRFHQSE